MGNQPVLLRDLHEPNLLWMGNQPVSQRAPQAEDPWMGNHSVPLQDVHKLKTAVLTETQTSYTLLSGP